MGDNHDAERNVPQTGLETALPQDGVRWWKKRHLVSLNFKIVSLIMLCKCAVRSVDPVPYQCTNLAMKHTQEDMTGPS